MEDGQAIQYPKEYGQITNKDLQNTIQKTKDRATRPLLKPEVNPSPLEE
jgi:hypothetical protein